MRIFHPISVATELLDEDGFGPFSWRDEERFRHRQFSGGACFEFSKDVLSGPPALFISSWPSLFCRRSDLGVLNALDLVNIGKIECFSDRWGASYFVGEPVCKFSNADEWIKFNESVFSRFSSPVGITERSSDGLEAEVDSLSALLKKRHRVAAFFLPKVISLQQPRDLKFFEFEGYIFAEALASRIFDEEPSVIVELSYSVEVRED